MKKEELTEKHVCNHTVWGAQVVIASITQLPRHGFES